MEKKYFYSLNEKTEGIPSSEMSARNPVFTNNIIGCGESGKAILNETLLSTM